MRSKHEINKVSIVTPIFNEEESIILLHEKLTNELEKLPYEYEIIMINDGSVDGSEGILADLAKKDNHVVVINFMKNFGQTEAMMAGFNHAQGDVIVTIDADLQNDPSDIPKLLDKVIEGNDVVSGWRKDRKDHAIKRNFLSSVANWIISAVSGVKLHDYGCTLKAYYKSSTNMINLYGEMHRFIPIYSHLTGAKVVEMPVLHHQRQFGQSKYGMERIFKVIFDLIVVRFLSKYFKSPIYLFGKFSIAFFFIATLSFFYGIYLKLLYSVAFIQTPLMLLTAMCFITGTICVLMGVLAEIIMRTYYESQNKKPYIIKEIVTYQDEAVLNAEK